MSFKIIQQYEVDSPKLISFIALCDEIRGDSFITTDMLKLPKLIIYSSNLMLTRWDEDKKDFLIRFFGSHLVDVHGKELTGEYIGSGDISVRNPYIGAHHQSMSERKVIYIFDTMRWSQNRNYIRFNQVIMPLERNGKIEETASLVDYLSGDK